MSPLRRTWNDYREAAGRFSRPARLYLLAELLAWTGHGVFQVLFNLYLVEGGFKESFIGRAISLNGIGLAVAAIPAGLLADRWGRRRCLLLGALLDGTGMILRVSVLAPGVIYASSFVAGAGQSLLAIAAAPFLTEHSTGRERTHLFSAFFATALIAGVVGSLLGGWVPAGLHALPASWRPDRLMAYRISLLLGGSFALIAAIPIARLRGLSEAPIERSTNATFREDARQLGPIALNFFLIGVGAGLVIPFMNLYFATRFHCTSAQIGTFFSIAQIFTAAAALLGPALARRFGLLRTATASQLLSLPFLVTLGAERRLSIAVGAFWMRATLMQASTPLIQTFVMEKLPAALRARSTSLGNLLWNIGWASSATLAGVVIQKFGYDVPFYITAALYCIAAVTFYVAFRHHAASGAMPRVSEETKGLRGGGPTPD